MSKLPPRRRHPARAGHPPRIVLGANSILRRPCKRVHQFGLPAERLVATLWATLVEFEALGVAAPQIGVPLRAAVVRADGQDVVLLNPLLKGATPLVTAEDEACLSLPGMAARLVPRAAGVTIDYQDVRGVRHRLVASGHLARVLQHELDHLDGRLISSRVPPNDFVRADRVPPGPSAQDLLHPPATA